MKDFIHYIQEYAELLGKCSVWHNTQEMIAPVLGTDSNKMPKDNYIYEFYCYIKIIEDLNNSYEIRFVEGKGTNKYKFPKAAAPKKGKPRFEAYEGGHCQFQICAGTKIDSSIDSEQNHPDISFQVPSSNDDPGHKDLILIMDAKYSENQETKIPKDEVYNFGQIVDLFELRRPPLIHIKFDKYKLLNGNCLITNAGSYSNPTDPRLLQKLWIKEVEKFSPSTIFNVIG